MGEIINIPVFQKLIPASLLVTWLLTEMTDTPVNKNQPVKNIFRPRISIQKCNQNPACVPLYTIILSIGVGQQSYKMPLGFDFFQIKT